MKLLAQFDEMFLGGSCFAVIAPIRRCLCRPKIGDLLLLDCLDLPF
jgi:hypothetical protein